MSSIPKFLGENVSIARNVFVCAWNVLWGTTNDDDEEIIAEYLLLWSGGVFGKSSPFYFPSLLAHLLFIRQLMY